MRQNHAFTKHSVSSPLLSRMGFGNRGIQCDAAGADGGQLGQDHSGQLRQQIAQAKGDQIITVELKRLHAKFAKPILSAISRVRAEAAGRVCLTAGVLLHKIKLNDWRRVQVWSDSHKENIN